MAAGKTTVARLLAARFERGVHLEGDVFRRFVVSGREEMTPDPSAEALEQLRLRYRLAAAAADKYFEAGFAVALEDVAAGPLLGEYRAMIRSRPCHVVVLLPSAEAVAAREAGREDKGYVGGWTVEQHHPDFAASTPRVGLWLDTTEQTPDETVNEILERTTFEGSPFVVVDYDEAWPALFEELAGPVREAVADLGAEVEHFGSTAVPGLAAKPIVDIDVVVTSTANVPAAIERLRGLGYVYQGDKGIPGREAFLWPPGAIPHHLYVVVAGSEPLVAHLAFRDHLRACPEVAAEYGALKRRLADEYRDNRAGYTEAKSEFVLGILQRTELPLAGGWTSEGVVRVGDTVRRPAGANGAFGAELLRHLEDVGFDGAPRFLGQDEQGRHILTFVEGEVPSDCRSSLWTDEEIAAAMELLRRFHDATAGSGLADPEEAVCHNDYGPWNLVWRGGSPVAIIDFDNAAPGPRLDDIGYAAWKFLNLGLVDLPVMEQRRRLRVLAESYRIELDAALLVAIESAQERMRLLLESAPDALAQLELEQRWLAEHGPALVS
jgi:GrpB-like predicted nucleotidyltransferase (UPF0157 family)